MTVYFPAPVLPSFTDEALTNGTVFGREEADKLLRLPAEYRQPCEAEVSRRTSYTDRSQANHRLTSTGDACAARTDIVAEILAQLAKRDAR